jgi:membrane-bound acyltransferase YfiQ involved in biofilm formation
MLGIVFLHSMGGFDAPGKPSLTTIALTTASKFGTIAFFLISGFLLGERIQERSRTEYFLRRVNRVFLPWALWFSVACLLFTVHVADKRERFPEPAELLRIAAHGIASALFDTAFWFVPNLLFCIAILLVFRRYLYRPLFGAVLLAFNLVYVVNIYTLWFPPRHTQAIFGFVFYLWLGSYAAHNFEAFNRFLVRVPSPIFASLAILGAFGAFLESYLLVALNNPDPTNTLRLTNQIFSILMVLAIFKFGQPTWPRIMNVRSHTFGLYLCHPIALPLIGYMLKHAAPRINVSLHSANLHGVLLRIAIAVVTYTCSWAVTMVIASSPSLQWMIGLPARKTTRPFAAGALDSEASLQTA